MKYAKKETGFITIAAIFIVASTAMLGVSGIKNNQKEQQERNNFYGEYVSATQEKQLLKQNAFYFPFNSHHVAEKYKLPLFAHARKLLKHPELKVYLNGHTDSSGPLVYNLKLGILRAQSVADILVSKGVAMNNISIISYANQLSIYGNDNRKVNIVYADKNLYE